MLPWLTAFRRAPPIRFGTSTVSRLLSTALPATCPSCTRPLPTHLPSCTNCWHIGDIPETAPYHEVLQVPASPNPFKVDMKSLRTNFLRAQQVCHPDMWAAQGETQRVLAERLSSKVNEAYKTLGDPTSRAQYLLELEGMGIQEREPPMEDMEALADIMETMEEVDSSNDEGTLKRIRSTNNQRRVRTIQALEDAFGVRDFTKAKSELVKLIYWERIDRSLKPKLEPGHVS